MTDAIILAGGSGKRLGLDVPKALIDLNGEKLIDKQIQDLQDFGIENIVIAEGYKAKEIQDYLGEKYESIFHSAEQEPLGTAGALNLAKKYISDDFIALNVDDLTEIDYFDFMKNGPDTIAITQMKSPYGIVHTRFGHVKRFEEKPILKNIWVSCGIYYLSKNIKLPEKGSLEKDVFPFMKLNSYKYTGSWHTFNTQKDIEEYIEELKE